MKDNPKKSKGQLSKHPVNKKVPLNRRAVVVIEPDSEMKVEIQTGSVSDLEMYMYLRDMTQHFASTLCADAKEAVGDSPEEQIKYLNWRIKQSGLNN
ncbi:MAG: hypothetical protein AB3N16_08005 [Flavobacteriaceae bacterium]